MHSFVNDNIEGANYKLSIDIKIDCIFNHEIEIKQNYDLRKLWFVFQIKQSQREMEMTLNVHFVKTVI